MSKFFLICFTIASIFTIVKYVIQVEGTKTEKLAFFMKTGKQAVMGISTQYKGRHWYKKTARMTAIYS